MRTTKETPKVGFIFFAIAQLSLATIIMQIMNMNKTNSNLNLNSNINYDFFITLAFYMFVFIIPIFIYIALIERASVYTYLKLNSNVKNGIFIGILISIFIILIFLILNKFQITNDINLKRDAFILIGGILVGPLEEISFRGFYMQKLKSFHGFWLANIITSLLFTSMHITEILNGQKNALLSLLMIFVIGLWMGYIFNKTKSLWSVAIVHSVYNLCIIII